MSEKTFTLTPRIQDALHMTIELFHNDARKFTNIPVLAHLLAVCSMVQFDGGDEDEAIAALLHDTLEDKAEFITRKDVEDRFGARVGEIVAISSDTPNNYKGGPKPPWRERKLSYLEHARQADPGLLRVTVADKIDNIRAILADHRRIGREVWKKFNASQPEIIWYHQEAVKAYKSAGFQGPLLEELQRLTGLLSGLPLDQS